MYLSKYSVAELTALQQYISENLTKGFIISNKAFFVSSIVFTKKPNGGLRFYVNYRKLNTITKKNRYLLPLINEILTQISRAKIFTKLDIRQAFYRICIVPESKELTVFRIQYRLF